MESPTVKEPGVAEQSAMSELSRDPASRKRFFKMVGGAGAASAFAIFLAACGDDEDETGQTGGGETTGEDTAGGGGENAGDLEIVNYALTLEYLEADFYTAVIDSGLVKDKKVASLAKEIGQNEQDHVDALTATVEQLGGTPATKPKTTFDSVLEGGLKMVLDTAATVENLGAAAYLGQAGRIKNKEVLAAALSIHSVEARHAAALNQLTGKSFVPDGAFAKPASMEEVLPEVMPFIQS